MSERYSIIHQETAAPAASDAPVKLLSYLLLYDRETGQDAVLLKLQASAPQPVTAAGVTIEAYGAGGRPCCAPLKCWYTDLDAENGSEFGAKTKVELPERGAQSCAVTVSAVRFADGSVWFADPEAAAAAARARSEGLAEEPAAEKVTAAAAQTAPAEQKTEPQPIQQLTPEERAAQEEALLAAKQAAAERAAEKKAKFIAGLHRLKWVWIGGGAAVAAALLAIFLIVPLIRYSVANHRLEQGDYAGASAIYAALDDFSRSEERLAVAGAMQNINSGYLEPGIKELLRHSTTVAVGYDVEKGRFAEEGWPTDDSFSAPEHFKGIPAAEKDYYIFEGWSVVQTACTLEKEQSYADLKFAAQYKPIDYQISYTNLQDGKTDNPTQYNFESPTIRLADPVRTGYTFLYWSEGNGTAEMKDAGVPAQSNGDKSFRANWKANSYTVKIAAKGEQPAEGETLGRTSFSFEYDAEYTLPRLQKRGYDFVGWTDGKETYLSGVWKTASDTELEPVFELSTYQLSYDIGSDAELAKANPETYTMLDPDITLNDPTRFGYQFVGWTWEDQTTAVKPAVLPGGSDGDKHFTAVWKGNPHTVTLDANGGSVASGSVGVTYGSKYSLPTPTRTGYDFTGWYSGSTKYSSGTWNLDQNVSVRASWTARKYTITLNAAGGSGAGSSVSVTYDSSYSLPTPKRTGYTFQGWYYNGVKYAGGTWTTDGAITLTAQWEGNRYTVTLNGNGGSVGQSSVSVTYGSAYALPTPSRVGYDFKGWSTSSSSYGSTFPASGTWNTDKNVTLYAKWEVKRCTIYMDLGGGTAYGGTSTTVDYGGRYRLSTPSRTGYRFDGWYYNGMPFESSGTYEIDGDITVIAHWTGEESTVYLDANGGSGVPGSVTLVYGSSYSLPTPYRDGYIFDGWYTSRNSGSRFPGSGISDSRSTVRLYAHWIEAPSDELTD